MKTHDQDYDLLKIITMNENIFSEFDRDFDCDFVNQRFDYLYLL